MCSSSGENRAFDTNATPVAVPPGPPDGQHGQHTHNSTVLLSDADAPYVLVVPERRILWKGAVDGHMQSRGGRGPGCSGRADCPGQTITHPGNRWARVRLRRVKGPDHSTTFEKTSRTIIGPCMESGMEIGHLKCAWHRAPKLPKLRREPAKLLRSGAIAATPSRKLDSLPNETGTALKMEECAGG